MDSAKMLAIGIGIGLGIAALFILHDISVNMRLKSLTAQPKEPAVNYVYDDQNRLTSIIPVTSVTLRPV